MHPVSVEYLSAQTAVEGRFRLTSTFLRQWWAVLSLHFGCCVGAMPHGICSATLQ